MKASALRHWPWMDFCLGPTHFSGDWQVWPPQSVGQQRSPELPQSLSVKQLSSHADLISDA